MSPHILLIAGPSNTGKSTLAKALANHIKHAGHSQIVVALDNYYRDLSHLSKEQRKQHDFDHPNAWEHERILQDIHTLKNGQPVEMPTYDFHTHLRSEITHRLEPADYMIFEGIFALYYEELSALADLRIYIAVENSTALERRILRDTTERGRTLNSVIEQFYSKVKDSNEQYIHPSKTRADIILRGNTPREMQLNAIMEHLKI